MEEIKIGDILYCNRRWGRIGETKYYIKGENKKSWLVVAEYWKDENIEERPHLVKKVLKKDLKENIPNYGYNQYYTGSQWADKIWKEEHQRKIIYLVEGEQSIDVLKDIADLVGYKYDETI